MNRSAKQLVFHPLAVLDFNGFSGMICLKQHQRLEIDVLEVSWNYWELA
jgi:hypothetical protein